MSSTDDCRGRPISWPIWVTYLILLAIGVPWYWPRGSTAVWFGMPAWVVTAIVASVATSVLTAVLLSRPWPGEEEDDELDAGPTANSTEDVK